MTDREKKERKRRAMARIEAVAAILRRWNPIGVDCLPANEYDSYAPPIVTLVAGGCSVDELSRHLADLRGEIGGSPRPEAEHALAAEIIAALRDAAP